jgi:hypothetical protein
MGEHHQGRLVWCGLALALLAATIATAQPASAAPLHTWVGGAGGRWSVAGNWSPAQLPEDGDDVVLPGGSNSVMDLAGLTVGDLTVTGAGATHLAVDQTEGIVVSGDLWSDTPLTVEAVEGPVQLQVLGTASAPSLAADGVQVILAGGTGGQSVGAASAVGVGTNWIGSVNLLRDGQHAPDAPLSSSPFGRIDLWGSDQVASSTTIGGSLYLGYYDDVAGPVTSVLQTGAFQQTATGHVAMQLGTTTSDQIRASSVSVQGALTFGIDGVVPIGHTIRIVDNQGTSAVSGRFAGLPEGAAPVSGQQRFRISYVGGTGNDITLTRLAGLQSTWWLAPAVDHGGGMIGSPSVSSWGPDRLDVWIVGGDDALWHRWQEDGQARWERLGGILTSSPAAISPAPGEVDVFARGADDALWVRSYRGGGWGPWRWLGGRITTAPAVTSTEPGTIEVVARGGDNAIWTRRSVNGVWQPWTSLGGATTDTPAITDWGPGELQITIRGGDGALWLRQMSGGVWAPWRSLGGRILDGPAMAAPAPGELVLYARGGDNRIWHMSEEGGGWSTWGPTGIPTSARPAVVATDHDQVELAVRTPSGSLHTHTGHHPVIRGPRDLSSS